MRVRDALRDRGAPTWRDLDDLASKPTEDELATALSDTDTAGAILLVSPEVETSPIIRNVEARGIFRRHDTQDGFLVMPVLIGLDYAKANVVLGAPAAFQNLGDWNLHKLSGNVVSEDDARAVARDVVRARLKAAAVVQPDGPLHVALFSRRDAGPGPFALRFDYTPYFEGRVPQNGTFARIETALLDSAGAVATAFNDLPIVATGNASLPLGVLFGAVFSPLAGFRIAWLQGFPGQQKESWSLDSGLSEIALNTKVAKGNPASEDIVLALGVSANIEKAVSEYLDANGVTRRAAVHISMDAGSVPQGVRLSPQNGLSIVLSAIQKVRDLKDDLGMSRARIHLFLACPLGMAVLLGQKLNTFSECVLYEHDPTAAQSYNRVHGFNPSGFTYHP